MRTELTGALLMPRLSKIRPYIFACVYIWTHVSQESRFRCCVDHKLEQFRPPTLIKTKFPYGIDDRSFIRIFNS